MKLRGDTVQTLLQKTLVEEIAGLETVPTLSIVQIGNDPRSGVYVKYKKKFGEMLKIPVEHVHLEEDSSQSDIFDTLTTLNNRDDVSGIILQLPIPEHLDKQALIEVIDPNKDVDGLTSVNVEKLRANDISGLVPATARGILTLLTHYKISIEGKNCLVIGRSALVGGPTAQVLRNNGGVVSVAHKETENTPELVRDAEILVVATGHPGLITPEMIREDQVIIDVGITVTEGGISGDVTKEAKEKAFQSTPVPGGIGPMTVVSLFQNLLKAHHLQGE
jgi:methylenetetrahydrofolate dehydrogenase (NADP+) / methenyltetrahydrofolate cyclohydrolase